MTLSSDVISLTSSNDSFLLTSTTFQRGFNHHIFLAWQHLSTLSLPSPSLTLVSHTLRNSASSLSKSSAFTSPSSAYSPICHQKIVKSKSKHPNKQTFSSDLVWRSGAHGLPVDVEAGLLPHVEPQDRLRLGVSLPTHFGKHRLHQNILYDHHQQSNF